MKSVIEYTGERVIPDKMKPTNGLLLEHLARYHFSYLYTKGRVLDFACGSGYGTHMLAKANKAHVSEIIGIDIDHDTVQYAKKAFYHPLVAYKQEDAVDPSLPDRLGLFDTIVSFETIEHVENELQFLRNIDRMLKPGGILILSTPFGQGRGKPCGSPFHVHQLTKEEFKDLFHMYRNVEFFGQRGVLIEPLEDGRDTYLPIGIAVCKK